ncbi:MAG: hypothetical protein KA328_06005, partial [Sulfurospirillum sp.]|nr:hypothetical protein [Sulfurospirillum sp.]
ARMLQALHTLFRLTLKPLTLFTPTPSTYSTLMYYTGLHYKTRKPLFVEKDTLRKEKQKEIVVAKKERVFKSGFDS